MRRSSQLTAIGALCFVLLVARTARADHWDEHATLIANFAATDNVLDVPAGQPKEADIFFQVRPGAIVGYETPRSLQELIADVEALEFVRTNDTPSFDVHAGYHARFEPTARSSINITANGTTGKLSQLDTRSTSDQATVTAAPPGEVDVRAADATEQYNYTISPATEFLESLYGRFAQTNDHVTQAVTSDDGGGYIGVSHNWRNDSGQLQLGADILRLTRLGPSTGGTPNGFDRLDRQVNPYAQLRWLHDFNRRWSSALSGGLVVVNPYGVDPYNPDDHSRTRQYYPIVAGVLAYTDDWGHAQITAGRAVAPNLFIAQNTLNDSVVAQAVVPLWFVNNKRQGPQYIAAATIGYARTQLLDNGSSDPLGTFDVIHTDVGVSWQPRPGFTYGVRYEYFHQLADADASALFGSYARSTLWFTVAIRFPGTLTINVPKGQQNSVRADGADAKNVGDEPVVPDDDSEKPKASPGESSDGTSSDGVSGGVTNGNGNPNPGGGGTSGGD